MGKKKEEKNTEAQETKVQTEAEANQEPVEETQDKNAEELKKAQDALAAQKDSYLDLPQSTTTTESALRRKSFQFMTTLLQRQLNSFCL